MVSILDSPHRFSFQFTKNGSTAMYKSHTCEEGGAHPRICLPFAYELEKQLFIKKNRWSWPIKNESIVIFTKIKKNKKKKK